MRTVNLYGEDGIAIYLDAYDSILPFWCVADYAQVKVVGHQVYACPTQEAELKIRSAYIAKRAGRELAALRINPGRRPDLRECGNCKRKISAREARLKCPHRKEIM